RPGAPPSAGSPLGGSVDTCVGAARHRLGGGGASPDAPRPAALARSDAGVAAGRRPRGPGRGRPVRDRGAGIARRNGPCGPGSVAALSGASSAALLALVCGVVERRTGSGALLEQIERLHQLQTELLDLVDEDAAAFHAYLHAGRSGVGQDTALERMTRGPLAI